MIAACSRHRNRAYTLIGVVMHEGTATAGHYWAFVRTEANAWFRCDDAVVEEAELTRVLEEGRAGAGLGRLARTFCCTASANSAR